LSAAEAASLESRGSAPEVKTTEELLNEEASNATTQRTRDASASAALPSIDEARNRAGEVLSKDGVEDPRFSSPVHADTAASPTKRTGRWDGFRVHGDPTSGFIGNLGSTEAICRAMDESQERRIAEAIDPSIYTLAELASWTGYSETQLLSALDAVANKFLITHTKGFKGHPDTRQWVVDLETKDNMVAWLAKHHAPKLGENPQATQDDSITANRVQIAYTRAVQRCGGNPTFADRAVEDWGGGDTLANASPDTFPFLLRALNEIAIRETARKTIDTPVDSEFVALCKRYGIQKVGQLELDQQEAFLIELDGIATKLAPVVATPAPVVESTATPEVAPAVPNVVACRFAELAESGFENEARRALTRFGADTPESVKPEDQAGVLSAFEAILPPEVEAE